MQHTYIEMCCCLNYVVYVRIYFYRPCMMLVKEGGALMSPSKRMMEMYVGAVLYMGSLVLK